MSRGVLSLDRQCELAGLPVPVAEFKFHPVRRWRFDWAFVEQQLAVEQEGGVFIGGRHSRGVGFEADLIKYSEAMVLGWKVLRVSPAMVRDGRALGYLERLLRDGRG